MLPSHLSWPAISAPGDGRPRRCSRREIGAGARLRMAAECTEPIRGGESMSARIEDEETRRAVIRGFNMVTADYFREFSDRLTPAAVIPMYNPDEAIEELEFVTKQLGSKVAMFGSGIKRVLPAAKGLAPEVTKVAV